MKKIFILTILFLCVTFINSNVNDLEKSLNNYQNTYKEVINKNYEPPVFISSKLPDNIYEKMLGNSIPLKYKEKVDKSSLSYLKLSYWGFDGNSHIGEMIVNSKLADEVLEIFMELYDIKYPIEKIKLIDEYGADDELSMSDNNTSCFCYRTVAGTSYISNHGLGCAIDINPLYNPYVSGNIVSPVSGAIYANRNQNLSYQISENDELYKIFISHGWSWGGSWNGKKDYQHFEKRL